VTFWFESSCNEISWKLLKGFIPSTHPFFLFHQIICVSFQDASVKENAYLSSYTVWPYFYTGGKNCTIRCTYSENFVRNWAGKYEKYGFERNLAGKYGQALPQIRSTPQIGWQVCECYNILVTQAIVNITSKHNFWTFCFVYHIIKVHINFSLEKKVLWIWNTSPECLVQGVSCVQAVSFVHRNNYYFSDYQLKSVIF